MEVGGAEEEARYDHIVVCWEIIRQERTVDASEYYLLYQWAQKPVSHDGPNVVLTPSDPGGLSTRSVALEPSLAK